MSLTHQLTKTDCPVLFGIPFYSDLFVEFRYINDEFIIDELKVNVNEKPVDIDRAGLADGWIVEKYGVEMKVIASQSIEEQKRIENEKHGVTALYH